MYNTFYFITKKRGLLFWFCVLSFVKCRGMQITAVEYHFDVIIAVLFLKRKIVQPHLRNTRYYITFVINPPQRCLHKLILNQNI